MSSLGGGGGVSQMTALGEVQQMEGKQGFFEEEAFAAPGEEAD